MDAAAFAPTSDQRTQGQQTCGSGSGADLSNTEDSDRVCHSPELGTSTTECVEEAKARHRHDTTHTSQHQDETCGDLGLVIHLHSAKGKDGKDSKCPACECVDDAVGVVQALHSFPSQTHRVVVPTIIVHRVAATEDGDEEKGKAKCRVDAYSRQYCGALPLFKQNAVECNCERGFEKHVCQSVECELEDLVLAGFSIKSFTHLDVEGLTVTYIVATSTSFRSRPMTMSRLLSTVNMSCNKSIYWSGNSSFCIVYAPSQRP